ncbi:MAG: ChaN family lipoprotein [Rhizobacter sp.]|nr:ChaN family lipoprotein [Rhizobacter sp.]
MRLANALIGAFASALLVAGCASSAERGNWQARLSDNHVVLLGEVHDNHELLRLRLAVLERAFAAGWRPAIVMEQFDRDRQGDIDRARRERPEDAQHVIDLAVPAKSGWDWDDYRPFVALALAYRVPLVAANVSGADTARIVRGGYVAVFDAATIAALGLDRTIDPAWQAGQEHEIDLGHCSALPRDVWPRMARAQYARDAFMAQMLREHGAHGAVLLAGNGHARRDLGVPRWLALEPERVLTVGFLENDSALPAGAFDAVVRAPPAPRDDPCKRFAQPSLRVSAARSHSPVASSWRST